MDAGSAAPPEEPSLGEGTASDLQHSLFEVQDYSKRGQERDSTSCHITLAHILSVHLRCLVAKSQPCTRTTFYHKFLRQVIIELARLQPPLLSRAVSK